jgi:hypothetical protein
MQGINHYCAGHLCRKTTRHVRVRMESRTYYYCVHCGRRLETRAEYERHRPRAAQQPQE